MLRGELSDLGQPRDVASWLAPSSDGSTVPGSNERRRGLCVCRGGGCVFCPRMRAWKSFGKLEVFAHLNPRSSYNNDFCSRVWGEFLGAVEGCGSTICSLLLT